MNHFHEQLELFYGGITPNRAMVYARLREPPAGEGWSLSGAIRGPHCLYSTTLPATIRLSDAGPGETLLAKAMVPDPCYWSPELPFLYDVHVELKQGEKVLATADRLLGLRNFGARGKFLYLSGKRWTVRAALASTESPDLLAWHDAPLSMFCSSPPDDALCEEASRSGVMLIVRLDSTLDDLPRQLRRLARHASVAMAALDTEAPIGSTFAQEAPNVLLVAYPDTQGHRPDAAEIAAWIGIVEQPDFRGCIATLPGPVLALRPAAAADPVAARDQCDRLQAQLAPLGDFAGYIV